MNPERTREQIRQSMARVDELRGSFSPEGTQVRRKPRKLTTYGQKGGEGATRGRKATRYNFDFPDGSRGVKKSFFIQDETALVGVYQHDGVWHAAGVWRHGEPTDWLRRNYTFIEATRA